MKIYLAGFSWAIPGTVKPHDFCDFLKKQNKAKIKFEGHDRIFIVSELDGYVVGAILTIKTNKKFTTLSLKDIKLNVNRYKDDEPGADFNLFVMNPNESGDHLHGLYMYYHQTMKTRKFNRLIRRLFIGHQRSLQEKLLKGPAATDEKRIRDAKRKHPASMRVAEKIRAGDRNVWLASLARLSAVEYYVTTAMPGGGLFNDLGGDVVHKRMRVTFRAKAKASDIKTAVKDFLNKYNPFKGSLVGADSKDRKLTIPLRKPPGIFEIFEYDSVVNDGFIDSAQIAWSELLAEMVALAKSNIGEFGPVPKAKKKEASEG